MKDILLQLCKSIVVSRFGVKVASDADGENRARSEQWLARCGCREKQRGEFEQMGIWAKQDGHARIELAEGEGDCC